VTGRDPWAAVIDTADGQSVRRISPAGVVTLVAGLVGGFEGMVDGVGLIRAAGNRAVHGAWPSLAATVALCAA
jgi:hypothetical protein